MQNLFPIFGTDSDELTGEGEIGTPEAPIEVSPLAHVPTGVNAQRSESDRWKRFVAGDKKDKDTFLPSQTRAARRAQRRADRTTQRKHQRGYFRRELAKESAARDLLNLFLLADGATGAHPSFVARAQAALDKRIAYLQEQEAAQGREVTQDAVRAQLWKLAQAATLPVRKVSA